MIHVIPGSGSTWIENSFAKVNEDGSLEWVGLNQISKVEGFSEIMGDLHIDAEIDTIAFGRVYYSKTSSKRVVVGVFWVQHSA